MRCRMNPIKEIMSTELVTIGQPSTDLAVPSGMGIDFNSPLFQLKPATLSINQPNTQVDGAIKGKLRLSDTGDQFDELFCTLLVMPVEKRAYYVGQAGQLNRTPDNLMCFCSNVQRNASRVEVTGPDNKAKVAQAMRCNGCPKASWDKWRQTKQKEDLPGCDLYYYALLIDTKYKMPMQMFIRSKAKQPFEQGMEKLSRRFLMMKSQGLNPNIFDIGFTLKTKKIQTGALVSYVPELADFRAITQEEKVEFGTIYQQFVARQSKSSDIDPEMEAADQIAETTENLDAAVSGVGEVLEGEIVI
jgi:hypothetical protein